LLIFWIDDLDVYFDAFDGGDGEGGVLVKDDILEIGDDTDIVITSTPVEYGVHETVGDLFGLFLGVFESGEDLGDVFVDLLLG
jgi:hypothetical protein